MLIPRLLLTSVVTTALASCASQPSVSPARAPSTESAQGGAAYPTMKRWTASLNPTRSYNAGAVASERQNAYGRVELTVSPSSPTLSRVILSVTVPHTSGLDVVGWGISPGRCGSGSPTVLSPSSFPAIQVGTNGKGTVDAKVPFIIADGGDYHVDVFRGSGTQLTDVLTCGELRRES